MAYRIENAIILAAGKGERLRPLTLSTPKPLLAVREKPMIEWIIEALIKRKITQIFVVVGYLKEQFDYLRLKYGVQLIDNPDFGSANNIASLFYARKYLRNTVILDGDQIVWDSRIILNEIDRSGYACVYENGPTKEWVLSLDNQRTIMSCSKDGGPFGWRLMSLSYWCQPDSNRLCVLLEREYAVNHRTELYWDDIPMFLHFADFCLCAYEIQADALTEIDTVNEFYTFQ